MDNNFTCDLRSAHKWFCGGIVSVLIQLLPQIGMGQVGCFRFKLDSAGCAPFNVQVRNCFTPGQPIAYNFDLIRTPNLYYNADITNNGDTSHIYTTPGRYVFSQAASGNFSTPFTREVNVYARNSKPVFALRSCPNQIIVQVQDSVFSQIKVTIAGVDTYFSIKQDTLLRIPYPVASGFADVPVTITGTIPANCGNTALTDTVRVYRSLPLASILSITQTEATNGIDQYSFTAAIPQDVSARFYVNTFSNPLQSDTAPASSVGGASTFSYATPQSTAFRLTLRQGLECGRDASADSVVGFNIDTVRATPPTAVFAIQNLAQQSVSLQENDKSLVPVSLSDTAYIDTLPQECGGQACFKLITTTARPGRALVTYTSLPKCASPQGVLARPLRLVQSFWVDSLKAYRLSFSTGNAVLLNLALPSTGYELLQPASKKREVLTALPDCFQVGYTDSCGNDVGADSTFCPLVLRGEQLGKTTQLVWSGPKGYRPDTEFTYEVVVADPSGFIATYPNVVNTSFTDKSRYPSQRLTFRLLAKPSHPGTLPVDSVSISNPVEIRKTALVQMPDIFTPNGDGVNDSLVVKTEFVRQSTFTVFNTWGEALYRTGKAQIAWDGIFGGQPAPAGPLIAIFEGTDQEGAAIKVRKTILVVR